MYRRSVSVFCIAFILAIDSLFAAGGNVSDSLIGMIKKGLVKNDKEKYEILCRIAEESPDADIILHYSEQALDLAKKLKISPARPTVLEGAGYLNSGRLSLALECFTKAAGYYKKDGSEIGLAAVYMYISEAYNMQENHNNEKLYLKNAIALYKKEKDTVNLASALHNLGYACYSMGQYDSALVLFSETGEMYRKLGYSTQFAYCLGNSGLVYSKQAKYDKAEEFLLKAIGILEKQGDEYAITQYRIEYAGVLRHKGEISKGISVATKSYGTALKNKSIELERDAAQQLAQLYRVLGRYDSAFQYQTLYITYNDSIKNYKTVQKMADLRTEYEVSKKQAEVDVLEKNKLTQRMIIAALIIILLLAAGLIILYYYNLKRSRKLTAALNERRSLLEKQSAELQELNRIKDKFFSVISHDLRSPISSIAGISYMIKESMETNNTALLNEITNYIDQTVFSLTGLLENLLNWAQSQQGRIPFAEEKIDTKEAIQEVVTLFSTVALLKNIKINLKLKAKLYIMGDRNSMLMIIRNLLSNALKFTPAGGEVSITTSLITNDFAEIVVADKGTGIPPEKIPRLFEFTENKSTYGTDKEKGIGLGLNLVSEFVKLNKGTIDVKSTVGKGTSFILRFRAGD